MISNFQQSRTTNRWLLLLLAIGIVNVFANIIPLLYYAIVIIIVQFMVQKKHDWAFVFIMYAPVFGAFFAQQGIRGIGTILIWLGFLILLPDLLQQSVKLTRPILFVLILLLLLLLSIFISTGGDYAMQKYQSTVSCSLLSLVAFGHLLLFSEKHDGSSLSLSILIYSTFMLSYLTNLTGGTGLFDVFSFGSFREDLNFAKYEDSDLFVYNYQQIGLYACIGLCLYCFNKKQGISITGCFVFISCGLIVLGCQSRQGLFSYVILVLLFAIDLSRFKIGNIVVIAVILLSFYFWLNSLEGDTALFVLGQNELGTLSSRSLIRQTAWNSFLLHPITGVGYGRFYYDGYYGANEHNLIYEILAETGIVGGLVFGTLSLASIKKTNARCFLNEHKWLLGVIIAYFLRLMISSDLREGIGLFVLLFLLPVLTNQNKNIKYLNDEN